jgi:uncharacterized protein with GYD domain
MESKSTTAPVHGRRPRAEWEDTMPLYISRGNYSRDAINGMIAKADDRSEAVGKLLASVGGKLLGHYFTLGEYDFLVIAEAPSEKDMMAALLAVATTGSITNLNTTVAVPTAEMKSVFAKAGSVAGQFRPAGT